MVDVAKVSMFGIPVGIFNDLNMTKVLLAVVWNHHR